ncbi:hypothetical protein JW930_02775 [Candidatus Woesearchaeota archaeon]|nr:hypothetical protein [Candidatus Woesearchaeota archaeon]
MKKAELTLQYIFLIFVAVIAVFVIVGLITRMALNSEKFMCALTGKCDPDNGFSAESLEASDEDGFMNAIIKNAKICYERGSKGEVETRQTIAHCYAVKCIANGCTASCPDVQGEIEASIGSSNVDCTEFQNSNIAIIDFDYSLSKVIIK